MKWFHIPQKNISGLSEDDYETLDHIFIQEIFLKYMTFSNLVEGINRQSFEKCWYKNDSDWSRHRFREVLQIGLERSILCSFLI